MTGHKFNAGQTVSLLQSRSRPAPKDMFEIVRKLPAEQRGPQYRIKSLLDGHERVVTEDDLV